MSFFLLPRFTATRRPLVYSPIEGVFKLRGIFAFTTLNRVHVYPIDDNKPKETKNT